ncbi:MAG: radical SAM protein [Marinilabilia sp.]
MQTQQERLSSLREGRFLRLPHNSLKRYGMWFSLRAFLTNFEQYRNACSGSRIHNILKLMTSYLLSRIYGKPIMTAHPFALSVEPSGMCQLKCPECPTGAGVLNRPKGLLTLENFSKIINESESYLFYLNLYFQGEPLLHPHIAEIVRTAAKKHIYTTISTNAQRLDEKMCQKLVEAGLSRIVISLDGFTQPVYETYRRGGDVEIVKKGILQLLETRANAKQDHPLVVVQFLAFRHNIHELPEIKKWCRRTGVDKMEIKPAQLNAFGDRKISPPKEKSRYTTGENGIHQIKGHPYNHCWRQWSSAVITWNGTVGPCCYDKDLEWPYGNIHDQSLDEIWKSMYANSLRGHILSDRSGINICRNCPEGRNYLF